MTTKKRLFINSARLIEVADHTIIPTQLLYDQDGHHIGHTAITRCDDPNRLNINFKIALGKQNPLALDTQYETATGRRRTAYTLARDFIRSAVHGAQRRLKELGLALPNKVLIAEPIAMGAAQGINDDWLSNYRNSIRRILHDLFTEIDFLPEPFAVFQYYRYGVRHALVAQKRKHIALILDFGGGTFDASIIETTKSGDIAEAGRGSRPLAASSEPVGGFFLDQKISESLVSLVIERGVDKARLKQAWYDFDKCRNYDISNFDGTGSGYATFYAEYETCHVQRGARQTCNLPEHLRMGAAGSPVERHRMACARPNKPLCRTSGVARRPA